MRVTVTGGAGFIGVHLVGRLLAGGAELQVIDDFAVADPARLEEHPRLRVNRVDVRDAGGLEEALRAFEPEAVVHLAAHHFIPFCDAHPLETLEVNAKGTATLVRAAASVGGMRLILASSLAVYPPHPELLVEDMPLGPVDVYGHSKWQAELIARRTADELGLQCTVMRIANVYGPLETNPHVVPHIIEQVKRGDTIELGNLESRRDYVYVEDVVDAFVAVTAHAPSTNGVFNLSTGEDHSVRDLLNELGALLGRHFAPRTRADLVRRRDRPVLMADSSRLREAAGWQPRHGLRDGLRKLLVFEGLLES